MQKRSCLISNGEQDLDVRYGTMLEKVNKVNGNMTEMINNLNGTMAREMNNANSNVTRIEGVLWKLLISFVAVPTDDISSRS